MIWYFWIYVALWHILIIFLFWIYIPFRPKPRSPLDQSTSIPMRQPSVLSLSITLKISSNRTSVGRGDMGPYPSTWLGSGVGIRSCSELEELAPSRTSLWRVWGRVIHSRMNKMPFDAIFGSKLMGLVKREMGVWQKFCFLYGANLCDSSIDPISFHCSIIFVASVYKGVQLGDF